MFLRGQPREIIQSIHVHLATREGYEVRLRRVSPDNPLRAGRPFEPRQFGEERLNKQRRHTEAPAVGGGDHAASGGAMRRDEAGDDFGGDVRLSHNIKTAASTSAPISPSTPARTDDAIPVSQRGFKTSRTSSPSSSRFDGSAFAPVTTTTGRHPAPSAARTARLSRLSPRYRSVCFGRPMRE